MFLWRHFFAAFCLSPACLVLALVLRLVVPEAVTVTGVIYPSLASPPARVCKRSSFTPKIASCSRLRRKWRGPSPASGVRALAPFSSSPWSSFCFSPWLRRRGGGSPCFPIFLPATVPLSWFPLLARVPPLPSPAQLGGLLAAFAPLCP